MNKRTCIAFVALGGIAALVMNRMKNATQDEAHALETSKGSLGHTVRRALCFEQQPPAYFVVLNLWRRIHPSLFFARTLSVLLMFAYVATMDRIAKKNFRPATSRRMIVLAALHPVTLFGGTESRAYAAAMLLSARTADMFLDRLRGRRVSSVAVVLTAALALCTHYYCGVVLGGFAALLFVTRKWQQLQLFGVESLAILALNGAVLRKLPGQIDELYSERVSVWRALRIGTSAVISFVIPLKPRNRVLRASLNAAFVAALMRLACLEDLPGTKRRGQPGTALLVNAMGVMVLLQRVVGDSFFFPHHAVALHPLFLTSLAEQFDRETVYNQPEVGRVVDLALVLLALRTVAATFYPGAKRGDWRRVAHQLHSNADAGEPIFVFPGEYATALRLHYRGRNPIRALPREVDEWHWDPRLMALDGEKSVEALWGDVPVGQRCWLVTAAQRTFLSFDLGHQHLEAAVARRFRVKQEHRFFDSALCCLERISSPDLQPALQAEPECQWADTQLRAGTAPRDRAVHVAIRAAHELDPPGKGAVSIDERQSEVPPTIRTLQIGITASEIDGGAERYYFNLLRSLPVNGVRVRGLVFGDAGVLEANGGVTSFAAAGTGLLVRWSALRREVAVAIPTSDVVASHFAPYAFPVLDKIRTRPLVVHFHGSWALEGASVGNTKCFAAAKRTIERIVYGRGSRFIVLSQASGKILEREYCVSPDLIRIVPGGVDIKRFKSIGSRLEARRALGWPENRPTVVTVRRLVQSKGLERLIDSINIVRGTIPDILLIIAGTGSLAGDLHRRVRDLELDRWVRFIGIVGDELPTVYRAADLSIVPSIALEGFGLVVIEALACGTPTLVTPVTGLPEVVTDLDPKLILSGTGKHEIAQGIVEGVTGRVRLPSEVECIRYAERFDWCKIAKMVAEVYREVA